MKDLHLQKVLVPIKNNFGNEILVDMTKQDHKYWEDKFSFLKSERMPHPCFFLFKKETYISGNIIDKEDRIPDWSEDDKLVFECGLHYIYSNNAPHFYSSIKYLKKGKFEEWSGNSLNTIQRNFPKLAFIHNLHLSDMNGYPMYYDENGFYFVELNQPESLANLLRIPLIYAKSICKELNSWDNKTIEDTKEEIEEIKKIRSNAREMVTEGEVAIDEDVFGLEDKKQSIQRRHKKFKDICNDLKPKWFNEAIEAIEFFKK